MPVLTRIYKKYYKVYKYVYLVKLKKYIKTEYYSDADPLKLIYVNPADIKYMQIGNTGDNGSVKSRSRKRIFDKYEDMGRVVSGDWDMYRENYDNNEIYKMLVQRYQFNKKWDEIDIIQEYNSIIKKGGRVWHECASKNDIINRAEKVDKLYTIIKNDGYKPRYVLKANNIWHYFNEVTVNIGRYGDLLYHNSGAHRLALAKILNINSIPVRVLVRHKAWQDIRNTIKQYPVFPEHLKKYYNHPDIQDLKS